MKYPWFTELQDKCFPKSFYMDWKYFVFALKKLMNKYFLGLYLCEILGLSPQLHKYYSKDYPSILAMFLIKFCLQTLFKFFLKITSHSLSFRSPDLWYFSKSKRGQDTFCGHWAPCWKILRPELRGKHKEAHAVQTERKMRSLPFGGGYKTKKRRGASQVTKSTERLDWIHPTPSLNQCGDKDLEVLMLGRPMGVSFLGWGPGGEHSLRRLGSEKQTCGPSRWLPVKSLSRWHRE